MNQLFSEDKQKWWILLAMTTSLSMVYIDMSVLPVTLPTLSRELNFSSLSLQWIMNVYTLTLTILALAGGRLAERIGLKYAFCAGVLLFAIASALCGLSTTGFQMISSRILQGVGAALMIPSQQAIILEVFPPHQRGKALGLLVSTSSLFLTLGPLLGGALTQYLNWRYIFWINLPIAALGICMTMLIVPHFEKKRQAFDWFGFLTLGTGVTALMIGMMHIQSWGLRSPLTMLLFSFGIAMIVFLWRAEPRASHPLFDTSIIRNRSFIGGALCIFCNGFLIMITVYWAIFFQDILHYSASQTGALACFTYAPILFVAPLVGALVDRHGSYLPVCIGFSLTILSLCFFTATVTTYLLWTILMSLFFFGMNLPMVFTPSFISMMRDIPLDKRGIATGMSSTLRQFSSTFGIALFGTVFYQWHNWKFAHSLKQSTATQALNAAAFEGLLSQKPSAIVAIDKVPEPTAALIRENMIQSFISAFHAINILALLSACIGLFIAWRYLRPQKP